MRADKQASGSKKEKVRKKEELAFCYEVHCNSKTVKEEWSGEEEENRWARRDAAFYDDQGSVRIVHRHNKVIRYQSIALLLLNYAKTQQT